VNWIAAALVVLLPITAVAQQNVVVKACVFDTAAHTDTLTLEFSLRAFRGEDTLPDTLLTRGFGAMIGSHFVAPPSIGQLLYPNTYYPPFPYTATAGTLQFTLQPDGSMRDLKWFAPSADVATDAAIEQALHAAIAASEPRDLAVLVARKKKIGVRVRFAATSATGMHAALLRLRAPMVRIDSLPHTLPGEHGGPIPREAFSARTQFEAIIDQAGVVQRAGVQIVEVSDQGAGAYFLTNLINTRWAPALVGGCPVAFRLPYRISAALIKR
jgi:hypothetical protein